MAKIHTLRGNPILDSRGEWTLEVRLTTSDKQEFTASVPQGKSTGSHEVTTIAPAKAAAHVARIAKKCKGIDPREQEKIDHLLVGLDGTPQKKRLGGNTLLCISIAVARAGAAARKMPLWKHIHHLAGTKNKPRFPRLFVNMINGGLHAGNNLPFQEYLVIPKTNRIEDAVRTSTLIYHKLQGLLLHAKGKGAANVGDEGGFAPNFKDPTEPFALIMRAAQSAGKANAIHVGLDAAASNVKRPIMKLTAQYEKMARTFPFVYLEDPYGEEAFKAFAALKSVVGKRILIAGDDLTTTNTARMRLARETGSINAIIIKPNQIGTISESLDAVRLARTYGWNVVASHRSGETNDTFIADFAVGVGAYGLKLGAPARGERVVKYNRLLEIAHNQ